MRYRGPSSESSSDEGDSHDDDSDRSKRVEECLYGDPCHEVQSSRDEQRLYGEPQHETRKRDLPDLEVRFARFRVASRTGPASRSGRSTASPAETTEQ
jgi:hypothetical protein